MTVPREIAIDAVDVLNDLIADLAAGTNTYRDYRNRYNAQTFGPEQLVAVQKMCFSHLALALNKLGEFFRHYARLIPEEHRDTIRKLRQEIERRGVVEFRNKVAGHIWDNQHQRPLRHSEILERLDRLVEKDADEFLDWLNDLGEPPKKISVIQIIESMRDSLMKEYSVVNSEILSR